MFFRESETIELKEVVVDDIKKEIIAFANCNGGKLYIGVRDDGTVIGLDNTDSVSLQISNIEAYGTGMGKIMKAYEGMQEKPTIETTKNAFKIILPNINVKYETENMAAPIKESGVRFTSATEKKFSNEEEKIMGYIKTHGFITKNDALELLEVSSSTTSRIIRKMVKNNLLKQNGKARNTYYTIIE